MFEQRILIFIFLILFGCGSEPNKVILERDGKHLAGLYCKARVLREQRFLLADLIRFTEDSTKIYQDERANVYLYRLDSLNALTVELHRKTKIMADSIHAIQQLLNEETYHTKEARKALDLAFQKAINALCPEKPVK